MKNYILIAIIITMFSLAFMFRPTKQFTATYQPVKQISQVQSEVNFWKDRLEQDPENPSYMIKYADASVHFFDITSEIDALYNAQLSYQKALTKLNEEDVDLLQKLAHLSIKKHDFKSAKKHLEKALEIYPEGESARFMLHDVLAELGAYEDADKLLFESDQRGFQFLIRSAKWHDRNNRLDSAIIQLEEARLIAINGQDDNLLKWIHSNLGDFYGHAGELEKSKKSFQKALQLNPADWYSYKGLARIAWSAHGYSDRAIEMLDEIIMHNSSPSVLLLKADILEYTGKNDMAEGIREMVHYTTTNEKYGDMYNAFNFNYHIHKQELTLAKKYALREMEVRETPDSFLLQSLMAFHSNNRELAEEIARERILPRTFEPQILYDLLPVIASDTGVHREILSELQEAEFELGPLAYAKLKK